MKGMDHIFICMDYNGEWKIVDNRIWEWFGTGCNKGFMVDRVSSETFNKMAPSKICGDSDVEDLLKEFYVPNEDIPQSGEGIIGSNPTPDDIVHESGNNELQECDKVVEENNDVIENDIVVGGGQIIPYQHYDMFMGNVAQCNREASQDSGRHDGSNLKVGQHFVSKDELSYYLSIIAINGRFEMRTTKSNKSIKEVRCGSKNRLWRVRATKMKDSHFFVIRQYHSLHRTL
ncbi:hypothetical protein F8388_016458 [Cannabis sativa]|uniref:Transposase MuDR plant domain-containing protein n=1 Tax=Cannabis sativa TaxID=3483 RepID=A0A7J6GTD2_CANSA|nr:hypothetical protein F8388_016458 [Cannabis sativa]